MLLYGSYDTKAAMTRTRLAEGHLDEDRLRDRLTPLYAQPGIQLVILFGSTVKGQKHRRSDLDLFSKAALIAYLKLSHEHPSLLRRLPQPLKNLVKRFLIN